MASTAQSRRGRAAAIALLLPLALFAVLLTRAQDEAAASGGGHHRAPVLLGYNDDFNYFELHTPASQDPLTGLPLPWPFGEHGHHQPPPSQVAGGTELMDRARAGGADTIRYVVPWARVERQRGSYRWSVEDDTYHAALRRGLRPVIVLFTAPCWAHPSISCDADFTAVRPDPSYVGDFARFVRAAVDRYPQAAAFEIWNESNLKKYWGPRPSPGSYVRMLSAVNRHLAGAGPHPPVLFNGVSPKPGWQRYIRLSLVKRHGGKYVSGIGVHPYVGAAGVNAVRADLASVEAIARRGHAPRGLWITEMGWTTSVDAETGISPEAQASRIDKVVSLAPKLGLRSVVIHRLQDIAGESPFERGAGVLSLHADPKPIYCTLGSSYGLQALPAGC